MNPTELPDSCPFCGSVVSVLADGKPCRAADCAWVHFKCLTSMHRGQNPRMCQSRPCEEAERQRLTIEADALRTASAGLMNEARQLSDLRERAEERVKRLEEAGQDAIDYIDGKHRDAGRALDGWRKAIQ